MGDIEGNTHFPSGKYLAGLKTQRERLGRGAAFVLLALYHHSAPLECMPMYKTSFAMEMLYSAPMAFFVIPCKVFELHIFIAKKLVSISDFTMH